MIRKGLLAAALLAASSSAIAQTMPLEDAALMFGSRQSVEYISLSPSGEKIAVIAPSGTHGERLLVVDLAGDATPRAILNNSDKMTDIGYCDWATESRLVCGIFVLTNQTGRLLGFTRLVSVDATSGKIEVITPQLSDRALYNNQHGGSILALDVADRPNRILMTRQFVPERSTGTRLASDKEGLGVEEIDITNGRTSNVEQPAEDAVRYIADENGRVRIMVRQPFDTSGNIGSRQIYYYRAKDDDSWRNLGEARVDAQTLTGFYPVAVDTARDVAYGFDTKDGYTALLAIALDGSARREQVLARGDVDVDQLIRIGRRNRVVGASYATEKRQVSYIDAELAKFAEDLGAALPGKPLVDIVDASQDESELLVIASSDTDPGMAYLYDKASRQLNELLPLRDRLRGVEMAPMTPVSFPAADGTMIPGYLTLPPGITEARDLPAIVLPHGGPSARDEWGFDWLVQFFVSQGYAVLQPNYRGSSGYGSAWFGRNGFQAWETAIGDVNDAGRWLVSQGMARPDRLAIVGWSYGGYAALQSQAVDPALYKAVVAIAPVADLELLREERRGFTSFALVDRFIGRGPHVRRQPGGERYLVPSAGAAVPRHGRPERRRRPVAADEGTARARGQAGELCRV